MKGSDDVAAFRCDEVAEVSSEVLETVASLAGTGSRATHQADATKAVQLPWKGAGVDETRPSVADAHSGRRALKRTTALETSILKEGAVWHNGWKLE
jgi:hypothetical protein